MELMDYLRVARKHWRSILAIVLLTVLGAGLYSMLSKPTYTATTSIFVSVASVNTTSDLNSGSSYAENQVKSFAVVATGETGFYGNVIVRKGTVANPPDARKR